MEEKIKLTPLQVDLINRLEAIKDEVARQASAAIQQAHAEQQEVIRLALTAAGREAGEYAVSQEPDGVYLVRQEKKGEAQE